MHNAVIARVIALKHAKISDLKQLWRDYFDEDAPPFNRRFLESRLAYRIQELAYGGLKRETVRELMRLGEQLDGGKRSVRSRRVDHRPIPGTRLIREWDGTPYGVVVGVNHFEYQGQRYKSLSAVARVITGVNRNGWTFFGLASIRKPQ